MADRYRTERVAPTVWVNEFARDRQPQRQMPHHPYPEVPPEPSPHDPTDVASVLGLPPEEVTPELLAALTPLLAEMERLRWQERQAERRLHQGERLADRHSVVPALNRRAFLREMCFVIDGCGGTLALLHVGGVERLRQLHGLVAAEAALRHVCGRLRGGLRTSDLVGLLGGSDFAVLLSVTDEPQAAAKMAELAQAINAPPFEWQGQGVTLPLFLGLHPLQAGESPESALGAADRVRHALG